MDHPPPEADRQPPNAADPYYLQHIILRESDGRTTLDVDPVQRPPRVGISSTRNVCLDRDQRSTTTVSCVAASCGGPCTGGRLFLSSPDSWWCSHSHRPGGPRTGQHSLLIGMSFVLLVDINPPPSHPSGLLPPGLAPAIADRPLPRPGIAPRRPATGRSTKRSGEAGIHSGRRYHGPLPLTGRGFRTIPRGAQCRPSHEPSRSCSSSS